MEFWTQLKKSGQEAAGRAKDMAEVTRLQMAQREKEARLEKLYAQLGKSVYDSAPFAEDSPHFPLASLITQLREELEENRAQLSLLKSGTRCAVCGALIEPDAAFCPSCGAKKEAERAPESVVAEDGKLLCPQCGRSVEPKAFCAFCGAKLS